MQVQFYHLTASDYDRALAPLAQKALQANYRLHIKLDSKEAVKKLDDWLWNYHQDSFLPHGTEGDGNEKEHPILLSTQMDRKNDANIMVITDGSYVEENTDKVERILDLFDGNDETTVQAARDRWRRYKESGYELTYWQQQNGGWKKAA